MDALRTIQFYLNRLLPFTTPGTPLLQDIVHTLVLVAILYFAPAIPGDRPRRQPQINDDHDALARAAEDVPAEHYGPDTADAEAEVGNVDALDEDRADPDGPGPFAAQAEDEPDDDDDDDDDAFDGAQPGPANADAQRRIAAQANRQVGAKKARSIARRDQRRAYHEFVRSQAEEQRALEAEGAEEREAELFEEKRRRAVAEAALEEKARREREERREREKRAREEEMRAQREALGVVRKGLDERGAVEMKKVAEAAGRKGVEGQEWLEKLLRADGIVGRGKGWDGCARMVTGGGWVVRIGEEDMALAWKRAAEEQKAMGGKRAAKDEAKVTYADVGRALEEVVLQRAKA